MAGRISERSSLYRPDRRLSFPKLGELETAIRQCPVTGDRPQFESSFYEG
ncbi:hypothetical protein [Oculatella sp. LEGE 06141]